ncbi:MAG: CDP-alcohol phosphatidyltransferase family protein [Elusimicrobia bacterium]|nr:CDP-alcohol phosphatidyltransferase family protein [Elusimicrobiota bacterium]
MMPPQVLIEVPDQIPLVATLPAPVRAAERLARAGVRSVVLRTSSPAFGERFQSALERFPGVRAEAGGPSGLPAAIDAGSPLLVVSPDGMPHAGAIDAMLRSLNGQPLVFHWNGTEVGRYHLAASAWRERSAEARAVELPSDGWTPVRGPADVAPAERVLFGELWHDKDGYIARYDRVVSTALSRRLVPFSVTPSQITTASLAVGLLGAGLLAAGSYGLSVAGAACLWLSCILDGCDGEVARIKLQCSDKGASYDLLADHICHAATFAGIIANVVRRQPDHPWLWPAALFMTGVGACMTSVWWLVLRRPDSERKRLERVFERVASRDYVYLVAGLVLIDRLEWFVWAAAFGAHLFWMGLWWIAL